MAQRVAGIDGLRVPAVLSVFAFHVNGDRFPNGGAGVDVFFVISGFVITRLLLSAAAAPGGLSLRTFYRRRFQRLMPALAVVVAAAVVLAGLPSVYGQPLSAPPIAAVYAMDFAELTGYHAGILGHTWSLGVEEQFYLLWPLLLVAVLRRRTRAPETMNVALAVLIVAPLLWRVVLHVALHATLQRIYFGPDARIDQLVIGCALAVLLSRDEAGWRRARTAAHVLVWPAVVLLLAIVTQVHELGAATRIQTADIVAGPTVVATCTAALIVVLVAEPGHLLTRLLGQRQLALAGARYSYAFYLWHLPVVLILQDHPFRHMTPVMFLASAGLAVASYHLLERRFTPTRAREL